MAISPFTRSAPLPEGQIAITPLGSYDIPADTNSTGFYTPLNVLVQPAILAQIVDIQSVWVDASRAVDPVVLRNVQTKQYQVWPAGSTGWRTLLVKADAMQMEMYCFSAATIAVAVSSGLVPEFVSDGGYVKSSPYAAVTSVAASVADKQILAENVRRQGYSVYNDGAARLALLNRGRNAGAASFANFSVVVEPYDYFESPFEYGGEVRGIWSAALGSARVTEYS